MFTDDTNRPYLKTSPRDLFSARASRSQEQNPSVPTSHGHRPALDNVEQQVWFVMAFSIVSLVIVAFLANGEGAGSQHHHFVRYVLVGLFVAGAGMIGLVLMNAACGCLGLGQGDLADLSVTATITMTPLSRPATSAVKEGAERPQFRDRAVFAEEAQPVMRAAPVPRPAPLEIRANSSETGAEEPVNLPVDYTPHRETSSVAEEYRPPARRRRARRA